MCIPNIPVLLQHHSVDYWYIASTDVCLCLENNVMYATPHCGFTCTKMIKVHVGVLREILVDVFIVIFQVWLCI